MRGDPRVFQHLREFRPCTTFAADVSVAEQGREPERRGFALALRPPGVVVVFTKRETCTAQAFELGFRVTSRDDLSDGGV